MKIYIAGPISGKSKADVMQYWDEARRHFADLGYEVFSPMTGKDHFRNDLPSEKFVSTGYKNPISTDHAITHRDLWMVQNSDVIYVNLYKAERVSIGCVSELALAKAFGKHAVVAMEDGGVHDHAFVRENATIVFSNPDDAEKYLAALIR